MGDDVKKMSIIDPEESGRMHRYLYWSIYKFFNRTRAAYHKEYRDRNQYIIKKIQMNNRNNIAIPYSSRNESPIDRLEKLEIQVCASRILGQFDNLSQS